MKTLSQSEVDPAVFTINAGLGWRIESTTRGFTLFNQFGYAGTFESVNAALRADAAMSVEPQ